MSDKTLQAGKGAGQGRDERKIESARLSVILSPTIAEALQRIINHRQISITEAVRRAIALYDYVDRLDPETDRLQVASKDGTLKEIVLTP